MSAVRSTQTRRAALPALLVLTIVGVSRIALAQTSDVGPSSVRSQHFGRASLADPNEEGFDALGAALATGDFDGDGADDLAIGVSGSDGPGEAGSLFGAVVVRYGAAGTGLDAAGTGTLLGQFVVGSPDPPGDNDGFGASLAACDFDGDGYDDLAVGVPSESVSTQQDAGAVQIYYGSISGLDPTTSNLLTEDTPGIPTTALVNDRFGLRLACGDFNLDGEDDLVVGAPFEAAGGDSESGLVIVVPGSPTGLAPASSFELHQDVSGVLGETEAGDRFGWSLAVGRFDGDLADDLAVGIRFEVEVPGVRSGGFAVFYGGAFSLTSVGDQLYFESWFGGTDEDEDEFGAALGAGDFDADGFHDLAVGVPAESIGAATLTGSFVEVFGSSDGLASSRSEIFDQNLIHGAGESESSDLFGSAFAVGDFDGDGADDLAVGHSEETVLVEDDGAVTVVAGAAGTGIDPEPNRHRRFARSVDGIPGEATFQGHFGGTLASGDFDDDGFADLAIGAPREITDDALFVGSVTILYGSLFSDGFESGDFDFWSDFAPHP